jgi:hypothetical protein
MEVHVQELRRQFLLSGLGILGVVAWRMRLYAEPQARKMPTPPQPAESQSSIPDNAGRRPSYRAILQQHEKEFRDSLAALFERVSELKREVDQMHSSDIFSVKIYKQTGEIEHLAKQLRTLAKT